MVVIGEADGPVRVAEAAEEVVLVEPVDGIGVGLCPQTRVHTRNQTETRSMTEN